MRFSVGARLGAYELRSILDAGGMGEVYRARDTRLGREVAIKVLPEAFATDPARRQRLNREARAVSSLNHPHICTLHDIGSEDGTDYLVMELIAGESLAVRLGRGPLASHEALDRAIEIAGALSAAHRLGIVHRDLKPANVMLTATGAKLLDFGVAVIRPADDAFDGPTQTKSLSEEGVMVGTLPYMAPEQVEGRTVDARTDIFAFGALLYEMLSARRAFGGESRAAVVAAILKEDPFAADDGTIATPFGLNRVVRKCLAKDPDERWQTARDLRDELSWIAECAALPDQRISSRELNTPTVSRRGRLAWAIAAVASLGLIVTLAWPLLRSSSPPTAAEVRLDVATTPTQSPTSLLSLALSPDGQKLAYVASSDGVDRLWVRSLDSPVATPLKGTEGASYPFWRPDGQSIGFFANGMLYRIDLGGGAVQQLAPANAGRGGAWNREGTIVFSPGNIDPLYRISDTGGTPVPLTQLLAEQHGAHRFPQFLPDGEHVVFYASGGTSGLFSVALSTGAITRLVESDTAAAIAPGHLLFVRRGTLYGVRFDDRRVATDGEPFPVAESVTFIPSKGAFAASATGTVAYRAGGRLRDQLVWLDRSGTTARSILAPDAGGLFNPAVSTDGRVLIQRDLDGSYDLWLADGTRPGFQRMTSDKASEWCAVWSPDGQRFVFTSNRSGAYDLYQRPVVGADEILLKSSAMKIPTDWSRDGRYVLYRVHRETRSDLWVLPLAGGSQPFPFLETRFDEREGQFSPDGRWVAYQSDESGRYQIYLQPFPGPGERNPVTVDGGTQPRWRRDGRELYYLAPDEKLMAVPVSLNGNSLPQFSPPIALFQTQISGGPVPGANRQQYDVSPDGQRFLMSVSVVDANVPPISIVLNWNPVSRR